MPKVSLFFLSNYNLKRNVIRVKNILTSDTLPVRSQTTGSSVLAMSVYRAPTVGLSRCEALGGTCRRVVHA